MVRGDVKDFFTRGIKNAPGYEYGAFQAHKETFSFFNLGCLTAPQVMNTAPSRRSSSRKRRVSVSEP